MKNPGYIVVGVDGSPSSLDALHWAMGHADLTGAGVRAVLAWEYPRLSGVDPLTAHVDWPANARQTLDAALEKTVDVYTADVSSAAVEGHPAQVLLDASVGAATARLRQQRPRRLQRDAARLGAGAHHHQRHVPRPGNEPRLLFAECFVAVSQLRPGSGNFVAGGVLPIAGALFGHGPVGRSFPYSSGSGRGGPRLVARHVSGHAAHRVPAQCLRRGDGNTSGPPARMVTGSARVCRADDIVDRGVGIGPDNAGNAVPHPTWTGQAGGSFLRQERGAPIGPVDVITVWQSNVLNPTSPSKKRPSPPRQTEP